MLEGARREEFSDQMNMVQSVGPSSRYLIEDQRLSAANASSCLKTRRSQIVSSEWRMPLLEVGFLENSSEPQMSLQRYLTERAHQSGSVYRLLLNLRSGPSLSSREIGKFLEKGSVLSPWHATPLKAWVINTWVLRRDSSQPQETTLDGTSQRTSPCWQDVIHSTFAWPADSCNGGRGRKEFRDLSLFTKFLLPLLVQGYIK